MPPTTRALPTAALLLATLLAGCGYVLGTSGQADGKGAGTLATLAATHALTVVPFATATTEGDASPLATRAARERLALRALPSPPADAPVLLVGGEVLETEALPVAFDAALAPTLWRVRVKLRMDVAPPDAEGRPDRAKLRAVATVEASVETPGGTDVQATETARRLGFVRALEAAIDAAYARLEPR